jgi:hypothetical protein
MPQITAAAFKAVFTATSRASDPEVKWALRGGLKKLRKLVGAAAVADYIADEPEDEDRADDFEMAHAHLAYGVLAKRAGSRLREGGIVISETLTEDDAKVTYMTPEQVKTFVADLEAEALEYLEPYLLAETILESGGVEFCHPAAVGCGDC